MKQAQFDIRYRPKYQKLNQWYSDYVQLTSVVNYQSGETIKKATDSSQIQFHNKILQTEAVDSVTYSSGKYTINFASNVFSINQYRYFTVRDQTTKDRYKIESNTTNSITILPPTEFTLPSPPTNMEVAEILLPMFDIGDEIDTYVYQVENGAYRDITDADLHFVGQIKGISDSYGEGGLITTITLEKIDEVLFKSYTNPRLSAGGTFGTCMEKISYIIAHINQSNPNMLNIILDAPSTKRDGVTAFADIDYYTDYKSNYEAIEELLTDKYTDDGDYYFYIKPYFDSGSPVYKLYIRPKENIESSDLVEGTDFSFISRSKDKGEAVSLLVIRCGRDMYEKQITTYVIGDLKYGGVGKPIAYNFAGEIMTIEKINNPSDFDDDTPADNPVPLMPTPLKAGTGNYTTYYSVKASEAAVFPDYLSAGTFTATTEKEYREWVRWLAKAKARITGTQFLLQNNVVKNKVVIRYYNTPLNMIPGTVDRLRIDTVGWTPATLGGFNYTRKLRQSTKNINISDTGLTTDVEYEEDWELIGNE